MIPARITVQGLADAIARDVTEVQAVLTARQDPGAPEDFIGFRMARAVAKVLGVDIAVEARDLALEHLYEYEARGELGDGLEGRAGRLARGVVDNVDDIDAEIESASEHWSVARMPVVDRNVLRLGAYELRNEPGTSTGIIISEAVRLAQTYSTEKSGSFVNGVLAALAREIRV